MKTEQVIQQNVEQTRQIINQVKKLKNYDILDLTWKENQTSWNILECIEHLNLYGNFYLPEIERKIKKSNTKNELEFKSGVLGNYVAKIMLPKENLIKMKTFKDKNPLAANLDKTVIDIFIKQQIELTELLSYSRNVSINKVEINTSISSLIKLKLGDTFQFLINHNLRHLQQIEQILLRLNTAQ